MDISEIMGRPHNYILDEEGNPVPEPDPLKWAMFFRETEKRRVGWDEVEYEGKTYTVSTVFLGSDHNFMQQGPPILYETMIFCEEDHDWQDFQERYTDRASALAGHRGAITYLKAGRFTKGE